MKRMVSLLLCLLLVASFAVSASADETVTLTLNGSKPNHTYKAYQIFSGDVTTDGKLTHYKWGSGFSADEAAAQATGEAFLAYLKQDEILIKNPLDANHAGTTMKAELATVDNLEELINEMSTWGNNLTRIDHFAEIVNRYMTGTEATATSTTSTYTFTGLEPGYYLIKDVTVTEEPMEDDFYTKFILNMTSTTTVTVKGDVPAVTKKVSESLNDGYGSAITNQLEKIHYYEWIGEIPDSIDNYDNYYYEFVDTMSAGLDFNRIEKIYIKTSNTEIPIYDAAQTPNPVVSQLLMPDVYPTAPIEGNEVKTITVRWANLKQKYPALESSDRIVIKYSGKLNEYAVVGETGTENQVVLNYSNNPNDTGKHGKTPPSETRVYTFGLDLTKIDGVTKEELADAKFYLYHNHTEFDVSGTPVLVPHYAVVTEVEVAEGITQKRITSWVTAKADATLFESDEDGKIVAYGLKQGTDYYLHEEEAPEGYNPLPADIKLHISSYTVSSQNPDEVATISYLVNSEAKTSTGDVAKAGMVAVTVENKEGSTLPSTGGMGTTMLYIAGGILVLAAVVLLVTKKRMANAE